MAPGPAPLFDFETCAQDVARICRPYGLEAPRWREFRGSIRNFTAAALNVTELHLGRSRMSRVAASAADGTPPYYSLLMQLRGTARVSRTRDEIRLDAGDLMLLNSGDGIAIDASEGTQQIALNFIQAADIVRLDAIRHAAARRIPAAAGPAALLRDELVSVLRNAAHLNGVDVRDHVIDLLLASLGRSRSIPLASTARTDIEGIARYIDAHLHDVTLSPRRLAAEFQVSLRQLYRIVGAAGDLAPAAFIWQRRLQRAREQLAHGAGASITVIAHRCGFQDSAHFSRAFGKAFGESPSAFRRRCG